MRACVCSRANPVSVGVKLQVIAVYAMVGRFRPIDSLGVGRRRDAAREHSDPVAAGCFVLQPAEPPPPPRFAATSQGCKFELRMIVDRCLCKIQPRAHVDCIGENCWLHFALFSSESKRDGSKSKKQKANPGGAVVLKRGCLFFFFLLEWDPRRLE